MSKSKPTKHLKLHSSLPDLYEQWSAVINTKEHALTREAMERVFGLFGGWICGRCGKLMKEGEGKGRVIHGESTYVPTLGEIGLPPRISQYKYCPRCFDVLENDGKPKLMVCPPEWGDCD